MSQTMKNVEYNTETTNIYFYAVCSHYNTRSTYLQIITTLKKWNFQFPEVVKVPWINFRHRLQRNSSHETFNMKDLYGEYFKH